MSTASLVYPEIFVTGVVPQDANKLELMAKALMAWGNTHMGYPLPEHFGTAMAEISFRLDVLGTPESFIAKSKEWQDAGMPLDFFENPIYQKPKSGKSKFQLLQEQNERLKTAIKDIVSAEIDHKQHGDPYDKLVACIVAANKVAFDSE